MSESFSLDFIFFFLYFFNILFFFFKQKTAYEIKECDWSSDVCSSDLIHNLKESVPGILVNDWIVIVKTPGKIFYYAKLRGMSPTLYKVLTNNAKSRIIKLATGLECLNLAEKEFDIK